MSEADKETIRALRDALQAIAKRAEQLSFEPFDYAENFLFEELQKMAEDALAQHDSQSGWQPIESAPRDGTEILVYGQWECEINGLQPEKFMGVAAFECGAFTSMRKEYYSFSTLGEFWMPLPTPPKEQE